MDTFFLLSGVVVLFCTQPSTAWMGAMYRNREALRPDLEYNAMEEPSFSPGMPVPRTGMWYQQRRSAIDLLQDNNLPDSVGCSGNPCRNEEGCCEAMICKLPEPEKKMGNSALGTCVPNPNEGTVCKDDAGCGGGMECVLTMEARGFKTCQPKVRDVSRKQYNDDCRHSLECDQTRGLCCQVHRRHRQGPRQLCLYYKDSHNCVGFKKDYMDEFVPNNKIKWWQY